MKKLILKSFLGLMLTQAAVAQGTDDPYFNLRKFYSSGNYNSARSQAMGGAFTALGGDLSNTYINPAGLGFYNRSEFSGTASFLGSNTTAHYIDNRQSLSRSPLNLTQIGAVFSKDAYGTRQKKNNWAISYNTLANFYNSYTYAATNSDHSISDAFVNSANQSGLSPEAIKNDYDKFSNAPNGYSMALMGGLIYYDNGKYVVTEDALPINQRGEVLETGNLGQFNLAYGTNFDDKTYFGASIGVQSLRFGRTSLYREAFSSNAKYLNSQYYENELNITGTGLNLNVGVIQRLNESINLGASITTPTLMWTNDQFVQYGGVSTKTSDAVLYNTNARTALDDMNYRITSPFKANVGLSAFLPNQIGVISAEAEFIGYGGMSMRVKNDTQYSNELDKGIKNEYKNVVNLKAGLELKHGIGRFRAGLNLINDPLRYPGDFNVKSNTVMSSVGLGIRKANFFLDASYTNFTSTGAYNPYVLGQDHYSVTTDQKRNIVGITFGSYF